MKMKLLCATSDQERFVETLLAVVLYQSQVHPGLGPSALVSVTQDQLREIAACRFGRETLPWDNPNEMRRLKRKYISSLLNGQQRPAERFELLREVEKGQRRKGAAPGTPSLYEPTGILTLIELSSQSSASIPPEAA
jgi:hypothetical protein